jgi:GNAT superfamily N-acetyltransferase
MIAMDTSTGQVRALRPSDLAAAVELSSVAGWNQTEEDWRMLVTAASTRCFGIEADGQLVSTTTLVCYGQRLAWIGMVLTKPEYRGRGFARRLLGHALDSANSLGVETVKLDATDQGKPLYEKFGFSAEQPIERWVCAGDSHSILSKRSRPIHPQSQKLDLDTFGADRSALLDQLAERSSVFSIADAFLFTRTGRTTAYLGPCVASDPDQACTLITECVRASPRANWSWDLLSANRNAAAFASELGFTRQRHLTRMAMGKPLRTRDEFIYAIAGFELG